jgi:hypothetical protein
MKPSSKWKGIFYYDAQLSNECGFEMTLSKKWLSQEYVGTIKDADNGHPQIARVSCRFKDTKIHFIKTYPSAWIIERNKPDRFIENKPSIIEYEGYYSEKEERYEGHWKIIEKSIKINGILYRFGRNTGSWWMKKQE